MVAIGVKFLASLREQLPYAVESVEAEGLETIAVLRARASERRAMPDHVPCSVNLEHRSANDPIGVPSRGVRRVPAPEGGTGEPGAVLEEGDAARRIDALGGEQLRGMIRARRSGRARARSSDRDPRLFSWSESCTGGAESPDGEPARERLRSSGPEHARCNATPSSSPLR